MTCFYFDLNLVTLTFSQIQGHININLLYKYYQDPTFCTWYVDKTTLYITAYPLWPLTSWLCPWIIYKISLYSTYLYIYSSFITIQPWMIYRRFIDEKTSMLTDGHKDGQIHGRTDTRNPGQALLDETRNIVDLYKLFKVSFHLQVSGLCNTWNSMRQNSFTHLRRCTISLITVFSAMWL